MRRICLVTFLFEYMLNFPSKRLEVFPYCNNHHLSKKIQFIIHTQTFHALATL